MSTNSTGSSERRQHSRILRPIDGRWLGGGVGNTGRIGDLSLGGCFVQSLSAPKIGETTAVTFEDHDGRPIAVKGVVVHIEPRIGFSVQFTEVPPEASERLAAFVQVLHAR